MKIAKVHLFIAPCLIMMASSANAVLNSGDVAPAAANSCEVPQVNNIQLSAYYPGCSADSGDDQPTPAGLRPTVFKLDSKDHKVVLAAAPMRMPPCASKCYKYKGGRSDDGNGRLDSALTQKTLYFDDLCPGCKPKVYKNGKVRKARIDIPMSCKLARNFRYLDVTLQPVKCDDAVMAEIESVRKIAGKKSSGKIRTAEAGSGR